MATKIIKETRGEFFINKNIVENIEGIFKIFYLSFYY